MKYFISVKASVNSQSIEYCIAKLNKLIIQRIVLAQSVLPVNVDMNSIINVWPSSEQASLAFCLPHNLLR